MIRLRKFEFHSPTSLQEAKKILSSNGQTKILAGGTDLVVGMKQETVQPKNILWLGKIHELQQITFSRKEGLKIGAMCTLSEIEHNTNIQKHFPSIIDAVKSIASPQIRNHATIGGNLCLNTRCFYYDQSDFWRNSLGNCLKYGNGICHAAPELSRCTAVFSSDLAPLLIALDANVELHSSQSTLKIPLSRLYNDDGKNHVSLFQSEILSSVSIPFNEKIKSAHGKIRARNSTDFAIANVGVELTFSSKNICEKANIVIGAISSSPIIVDTIAQKLIGENVSEKKIEEVANEISTHVHPMPNVDGAVNYRKKMVGLLVKRTLSTLVTNL
ncbi:MAG: FAD binding domain-containing protein [Ignavibacteriales bacterium]|nr:FAD binding domain-containing protein [Ignavibacteriales bacterium]